MQDPDKPLDSGAVGLPTVDGAMNKVPHLEKPDDKVHPLRPGNDPQKKLEDDAKILARARKRLQRCISAEAEMRREGLDDDKFYAGDQWPSEVKARRNAEKRPCLTLNKLPTLVRQVTNDQRQNRPSIAVHPVGDKGDLRVANIYQGLIRSIERDSVASIAYDTAFESAARKGFGYWRILTEYDAPDSFDQVITIKRIRNAYSVYLDPDKTEPDASDASYGFITEMIPRDEFEVQYPDFDPMPWVMGGFGDELRNWIEQYSVRVAEYYERELKARELVLLENGYEGWIDEIGAEALAKYKIVNRRKSLVPTITWYKLTAKEIIETTPWPGKWVPIVEVVGDEIDIEGRVRVSGLIRNAKDAQRLYNYWRTTEAELVALAPKAKWLVGEGQIEGYEDVWKEANNSPFPYLPYKPQTIGDQSVPPPIRQPPEGVPAGAVNAAQGASQDILATTGIRLDASQQDMRPYDESGKALHALRSMGDIGAFHLVDNLMNSLRHTCNILVDLIPHIYDRPGRILTILREDDREEQVQLGATGNQPVMDRRDPRTQEIMRIFDPKYGKYAVTSTIGPSYATKRIEAVSSMMDFGRALGPQAFALISDLIAKNMDWPESQEISARLAKTLPPGLVTPNMRDIPPQVQAILFQMQKQVQQLMQERQGLLQQVNERQSDRKLAQDRINKTFISQLLNIAQKAEDSAQKVQHQDRRVAAENMRTLAHDVMDLYQGLNTSKTGDQGPSSPSPPPLENARRAPDGNFYVPDPSRPGKYLQVMGEANA